MRIRILKSIVSTYGSFPLGAVVNIPEPVAKNWCEAGIACQDKSLDGATETKAIPRKGTRRKGVKYARSSNK